ncbi:MAG: 16S rRNA (uracil(1498)-N(3))-methyltransferase [Lewinellaceae bacterium]|nr:16S rRNA (uracil(1498)-N(3))-methyltransferase [Saprospiraceae bacterium]MCB9339953.1 16S rRNA (uracil(1498)-N(3))-methyltransferase [Lewinellaceae bacterium]
MNLFYTTNIKGDFAILEEEEARHCSQVLRRKAGDAIQLVDGKGNWYEGAIDEINKREVVVKIEDVEQEKDKRDFKLHIAIAPTKNMDRIEWFLEKSTELGIDEITPIHCHHSERGKIRQDRLEKILVSAMKQSLRTYLPKLNQMTEFKDFTNNPTTPAAAFRYIAHCQDDNLPHLKDNCPKGQDVIILVGPEGDFSKEEIELAIANGYQPISLGKARLRTETAGIAACHIVNLLNE